jgi:DNA polymerase elongation subunit (family B)
VKILLLDIETSPNLAYVWGLWQQNIGINQIENNGSVLCWSAKWLGEPKVHFASVQKMDESEMLRRIHVLCERADMIVHYNGKKFDIPVLNREWLKHGFAPPAPSKHLDLYQVCKSKFRFVSNKLDYVSQFLGLGKKIRHTGHELWTGCMRGDKNSWRAMKEYNVQDVALLETLYRKLRPWIDNHPSLGAFKGEACCPKCGSGHLQSRGVMVTSSQQYTRLQCQDCGGWSKRSRGLLPKGERVLNVATG